MLVLIVWATQIIFKGEIMAYAVKKDGQGWRAVNGVMDCNDEEDFSETQPPEKPILRTQFTSLEFLDRFTEDEQLTVVEATMQSAAVKLWYDRLLAAMFIDLTDPRTELGIDALIAGGLIAADRKAELLQLL